MSTRRQFLLGSVGAAALGACQFAAQRRSGTSFRVWAFGDAHVGTDKRFGRESLAEALRQSEHGAAEGGPRFDWDIAIDAGDVSGEQGLPRDPEGEELVRQFRALTQHRREDIYNVCGNHDRSGLNEPDAWWWQKWVDPLGRNTSFSGVDAAKRQFPITGTWERYSFRVGNILFLMMSDRNELSQKVGRGTIGGNPGGVVSGETFAWWKGMVDANRDSIIISVHHYVLKDTTVASGEWEGVGPKEEIRKNPKDPRRGSGRYHGYFEQGTPHAASYLYWVNGKADSRAFETYLEANPGAVQMWLGGHTHTNPDDTYGKKSHVEQKWGLHFINVAALTQYHVRRTTIPMSRLLTFTEGSNEVRVQCYLHTSQHAPQGWYRKAERTLRMTKRVAL